VQFFILDKSYLCLWEMPPDSSKMPTLCLFKWPFAKSGKRAAHVGIPMPGIVISLLLEQCFCCRLLECSFILPLPTSIDAKEETVAAAILVVEKRIFCLNGRDQRSLLAGIIASPVPMQQLL
jgi:hypothetical protein